MQKSNVHLVIMLAIVGLCMFAGYQIGSEVAPSITADRYRSGLQEGEFWSRGYNAQKRNSRTGGYIGVIVGGMVGGVLTRLIGLSADPEDHGEMDQDGVD